MLELLRNYVLVSPTKPVNVAVVGHANTGKSSVINALRRHPVAAVSQAPFYTKTSQVLFDLAFDSHFFCLQNI